MLRNLIVLLTIIVSVLYGCAINPVTGQRELSIISESRELDIGRQHYGYSRQMQGGDYIVDPDLTEYVNSVGQKLAGVSDRKLPYEFVVLNNSTPNAWALPGGKIAVNRGLLLELNNEAELAAVLGHEIVHAAARHGAKSMERGMLLQGAILATGIALAGHDYSNQIVGGAQLAAGLIHQKYSRNAELEADYYGMHYMSKAGYNPKAAVGLQETFVRLSKDRRQDWLSGLFASHPPSPERVETNRETGYILPSKGVLGAEQYQRMISNLKKTRDAYEAYDKGKKALHKGDAKQAMALAKKALKIEPREAQFYALVGDVNFKNKHCQAALNNYNQALEHNNQFFYFYVQRGMTKIELKDQNGAKGDLEKSLELLPTSAAYNALGNIALDKGNRQKAMRYFNAAADSKSETGRQARRSLILLDLPRNPNNYLKISTGLDKRGLVIAKVHNPTELLVGNVELIIQYQDASGKIREMIRYVPGTIAPGKTAYLSLGIGPVRDPSNLNRIRVAVAGAAVVK